jgi:hypothetical protein
VVQAHAGRARAMPQCCGMDSYLPWVINQSESELLNSRGKINNLQIQKKSVLG